MGKQVQLEALMYYWVNWHIGPQACHPTRVLDQKTARAILKLSQPGSWTIQLAQHTANKQASTLAGLWLSKQTGEKFNKNIVSKKTI